MNPWDERYQTPGYLYGETPNDFLVQCALHMPPGRVLCVAEGEGRNAVWLAERGFEVVAVYQSRVGLQKAEALAAARGVRIETHVADLATYAIEDQGFDGVVSIWCHVPKDLRVALHRAVVAGLRPGGVFVLEAYTPEQLGRGTGGPPVADLMMDAACLRHELEGLSLRLLEERERDVREGAGHQGWSAVVQLLAVKPGADEPIGRSR